jgi:hypothetical protein
MRYTPSIIGKLVCHVKTSPAHDSKPRDVLATWTGGQRGGTPAPRPDRAPPPKERHPLYPRRFNWFESTPRNAPRLPIQTNNQTTSELHTHVMSNENKFPSETSPALASKPRDARYLDRGTTRWNSRAPARQGPSPEERHPLYPHRFNWFESTPRNAPRLPIQTNNYATSEPHTHVMSNENKFPSRKKSW